MATIERKRATRRTEVRPEIAHAFCYCQHGLPEAEQRPICETAQGAGPDAPPTADRCVVCVQLVASGVRWCGHG